MKEQNKSDIVEWLRALDRQRKVAFGKDATGNSRYEEAAQEIEKLRSWQEEVVEARATVDVLNKKIQDLLQTNGKLLGHLDRIRSYCASI